MSKTDSKASPGIGFLTVVQAESLGRIGGLLVLNLRGRPTEFHCTSPVKPNRAQEILYGPTLDEYLNGEQIARTLIEKISAAPWLLCTDQPSVLAVRTAATIPLVLVHSAETSVAGATFVLSDQKVSLPLETEQERERIMSTWREQVGNFDLQEPFERIREAIREAQRGMAA